MQMKIIFSLVRNIVVPVMLIVMSITLIMTKGDLAACQEAAQMCVEIVNEN